MKYFLFSIIFILLVICVFCILKKRKDTYKKKVDLATNINQDKRSNLFQTDKLFYQNKNREFNLELEQIPSFEISLSDVKIKKRKLSERPLITFSNITKKTNIDNLFPLVIFDTETTGLSARDKIIELSAIKFDIGFKPISKFSTLVNPKTSIPSEASVVNHITDEMVSEAPEFYQIVPSFNKFIANCNCCGHNLDFDMKILFVNGVDFSEKKKYYDTLQIAEHTLKKPKRKYDSEFNEYIVDYNSDYDVDDYKLDTLCSYYRIYRSDAHRALSDCYATGKVFENLILDKQL